MKRIARILVATDFSTTSDDALAFAKRLGAQFGASVHLLHAFDDPFAAAAFAEVYAPLPPSVRDEALRGIERQLDERLTTEERDRFRGTAETVTGSPARVIVEYAATLAADLIVMGTHGRSGVSHLLLGSVAERVVRTAPCPVLTIRQTPSPRVERILVPTDFGASSDEALEAAYFLAEQFGAEVQLLHVLDDPLVAEGLVAEAYVTEAPTLRTAMLSDARDKLARRAAARAAIAPLPAVRLSSEVIFGHGAPTIVDYALQQGADLIVMGTYGRGAVAHALLGSVAERVVRTAPCPVLTVRHVPEPRPQTELVYDLAHLPA